VVRVPMYQLALPLTPHDCRQQQYAAGLTGTTI